MIYFLIFMMSIKSYQKLNHILSIINDNDYVIIIVYSPYFHKRTLKLQVSQQFLCNVWKFFICLSPVRDYCRLQRFYSCSKYNFSLFNFLCLLLMKLTNSKFVSPLFFLHKCVTIVVSDFFTVSFRNMAISVFTFFLSSSWN